MPASRASIGEVKCTTSPPRRISPESGITAPQIALISGRLAGAVVADDRQDLVGVEIEIGVVERGDATVALDELAAGEDGFDAHLETLRIHWSRATATMISTPMANSCQSTSRPASDTRRAEHADDQRPDQRTDDRAAAAEKARAADHHGGDAVEVGVLAGRRADRADPADQRPSRDRRR